MQNEYAKSTRYALAGHALLMAAALLISFWHGCLRRPREIPLEFTVVLDPGRVTPEPQIKPVSADPQPQDPEPIRDPDPPPPVPLAPVHAADALAPDKRPDKPPDPKPPDVKPADPKPADPKTAKPELKIGPRVFRTPPANKQLRNLQPRLTPAEVERMLKLGGTPGARDSLPEDDISRCMLLIKRALYAAWDPPSWADAGSRPAELELGLGAGGRVTGFRITLPSGNALYDRSVLAAAAAVSKIDGLTPAFIQRYDQLTVEFRLDENAKP